MSKGKLKKVVLQDPIQPNLVPMVDIMFLLLLFFILGADMSQREMADLVLPTADQVKENEKNIDLASGQLTVNVQHADLGRNAVCSINAQGRVCRQPDHWVIVIHGKELTREQALEVIKDDANRHMETVVDPVAGKLLSALKVIIRADRLAPYGDVNKIVELCGLGGVYKIEVGAAQPPKG